MDLPQVAKQSSAVWWPCPAIILDEGITRKAYFGKAWSRVCETWDYLVQDGEHSPQFAYTEKAAVSAIMSISGMKLCGNVVKYHIRRIV